jgi:hypothetical protein
MKEDTLIVSLIFACSLLSGLFGFIIGYHMMERKAVDEGAAKWTVDKHAHVQLEWIKQN